MGLIDETRARLRGISSGDASWRTVHYEAMARARREADRGAIVEIATLVAARLLSQGSQRDALAHLDFARAYAETADQAAHVLAMRSAALVAQGSIPLADAALAEARALSGLSADRALEVDVYAGLLDCAALREIDCRAMLELALRADRAGQEHWFSALVRWLVPAMFALGRGCDTEPLIDLLDVHAESVGHPWRMSDVAVFRRGVAAHQGRTRVALRAVHEPHAPEHRARLAMLGLYEALHQAELGETDLFANEIAHNRDGLMVDMQSTAGGFESLATVIGGGAFSAAFPPRHPTLLNLPGALATAEAVALSGTRQAVEAWFDWTEQLPAHVVTTLEWPVPVDYVRGLLAIRLGDRVRGLSYLGTSEAPPDGDASAACACKRVLATHMTLVSGSGESLRRLPFHARTAAQRLLDLPVSDTSLTQREIEVIREFARGHSLRATGALLGISWRTVQVHARNAYRKMDVHQRTEAIQVARQQGLLWEL